ncbi:MAG: restriction endonuclease [Pyrinomonadaceae bacterium]
MASTTHDLDLSSLSPKEFEELIYDLLHEEEFFNLEWRDGGADGGRDIAASTNETDASGFREKRTWFCDAKLYSKGIGFEIIQPTMAKATSHQVDYLLFAVWPHLTPPCKDDLAGWVDANKPRFKIRKWEKKDIERLLLKHPHLLKKYLPSAWSQRLEMDAYLRDAATVFQQFRERVAIVWKNPDARPFSDLIHFSIRGTPGEARVEMFDKSQNLTDTERAFLFALADALQHLEQLLKKALNITEPTAFIRIDWAEHPGIRILVPIPHTGILRSDVMDGVNRLLAGFDQDRSAGASRGVLTGASSWKPFNEKNRVAVYGIFPKVG